jgi:signal transduction histidine kinase
MKKHPLFLSFKDIPIEREFKRFYEQESRIYVRIGIFLSLLGWASMALMSYIVVPQKIGMLLPVILGSTFPAFIFILYSTYKDRFIGHYQWMATAANGIAGFLVIFTIHNFGTRYVAHGILIGLMLILFFAFYILRLQFKYAFVVTVGYMSAYQVYIIKFAELERAQFNLLTFAAWITVFFALYAGYLSESISRQLFVQRKTIDEQQEQMITKEKMAAVGNLVAGVAHEINNPIGAINSMTHTSRLCLEKIQSILATKESVSEVKKDSKFVKAMSILADHNKAISIAGGRIAEIIKSLKSFIRLDEAEYQRVNIHEGLDSTLTLLQGEMREQVSIIKEYGDIPNINCYAAQLNQVFINLLRNANQAIEGEGSITLKTSAEHDQIHIQISDNGKGIPPEKIDNLFDISFSDISGERVKMASGLSLAYNIVQKHEGTIRVESIVGQGTTFTIILPIK